MDVCEKSKVTHWLDELHASSERSSVLHSNSGLISILREGNRRRVLDFTLICVVLCGRPPHHRHASHLLTTTASKLQPRPPPYYSDQIQLWEFSSQTHPTQTDGATRIKRLCHPELSLKRFIRGRKATEHVGCGRR